MCNWWNWASLADFEVSSASLRGGGPDSYEVVGLTEDTVDLGHLFEEFHFGDGALFPGHVNGCFAAHATQ